MNDQRNHKALGGGFSGFESVRFKKSGKEISRAVAQRIVQEQQELEKYRNSIAEICKRRDISPDEVMAAHDEEAIATYSQKAETSLKGGQAGAMIRELQEDLQALRNYVRGVWLSESQIKNLQRVSSNIEAERSFDLTYSELVEFGF